jgi:transposase
MQAFSTQHQYYWYRRPTDMRKSFNGLSGLVCNEMQQSPTNGSVFIFVNKRRDKIKLLVWDRSGFVIYYKSLEQGTFDLPRFGADQVSMSIKWEELVMILEGVKLDSIHRKKRFRYPQKRA